MARREDGAEASHHPVVGSDAWPGGRRVGGHVEVEGVAQAEQGLVARPGVSRLDPGDLRGRDAGDAGQFVEGESDGGAAGAERAAEFEEIREKVADVTRCSSQVCTRCKNICARKSRFCATKRTYVRTRSRSPSRFAAEL